MAWKKLGLPEPTPVQYDIAKYLQHGPDRVFIGAFRGVGKSWITSAFAVWRLLMNPQTRILVVSASKDRADDWVKFTLSLIYLLPCCHHLAPRKGQRQSSIAFDVAPSRPDHQPSVKAKGITSQLSGGRADLIIPDDVEVPNNSATQLMRQKLRESVKEFDAILKPGGQIKFLGTPQNEDSLYFALPSDGDKGYMKRLWPSRVPTDEQAELMGDMLAPMIAEMRDDPNNIWMPTDPRRFDDEDLMVRELSYGRSGFALQFMLLPSLSDDERYPLRLRDLIAMDLQLEAGPEKVYWTNDKRNRLEDVPCVGRRNDGVFSSLAWMDERGKPPRMLPYQGRVMHIDPSGRGKDETGYVVTFMLHGMVYLVDAGGFQEGYTDRTLTSLVEIAKRFKVNEIVYEDNMGDGMFGELLKPHLVRSYPCTLTGERAAGMKEARIIDVLEPVVNQHRLVVDTKLFQKDFDSVSHMATDTAYQYRLFHQFTRICRERGALAHDDRLDALASAVKYWQEQLANDQEFAAKSARDEAFQREIEDFMEAADRWNGPPKGTAMTDNWGDDARLLDHGDLDAWVMSGR